MLAAGLGASVIPRQACMVPEQQGHDRVVRTVGRVEQAGDGARSKEMRDQ